jgi:hypothetical protein
VVAPLANRSARSLWVTRAAALLVGGGSVLALSPLDGGPELVGAWAVLLGVLVAAIVIAADRGPRPVTVDELRAIAVVAPLYGSLTGPVSTARPAARRRALQHLDAGLRALRAQRWSEAARYLVGALDDDPHLVSARHLAAVAMHRAHTEEAALPRASGWRPVQLPDAVLSA